MPELISEGKVTRGFLGLSTDDARGFAEALRRPDKGGAIVVAALPETPAALAGLKHDDVARKLNGQEVKAARIR